MEVKKEMTSETSGGRSRLVVTPEIGKVMFKKSMTIPPMMMDPALLNNGVNYNYAAR
jgi:hypothetical protein